MTKKIPFKQTALGAALLAAGSLAQAGLMTSYQFNGNGNWSLDAVGSNGDPVGSVEALIPAGSIIEKAFLYSTRHGNGGFGVTPVAPDIDFDGTTYSGAAWADLGSVVRASDNLTLNAYRTDVTTQVAGKLASDGPGTLSFSVRELTDNIDIDGEALAVVYSNPGEAERTIAFLDGAQEQTGDTFTVSYADPLDTTDPDFELLLSLGIGFSFQNGGPGQQTVVDVNGQRLTTSAGGEDDGGSFDGGLITMGGLGDSTNNPDPFQLPIGPSNPDDELYDLANGGFLNNGDLSTTFNTLNSSQDDLLFFAGINVTAVADVIVDPGVPEPFSLGLLGVGLAGAGLVRRRRRTS